MSGQAQLVLLFLGVHLAGLVCIAALVLPAIEAGPADGPVDHGSDDGRGNDRVPPTGPEIRPRGGLPLPDAVPARIRLREPGRLADHLPRRDRRPVREPARRPGRRPVTR